MVKKAAEATPNHLLRAARKERNWTQKEVADRIGAPQSFNISRWEQGTAFPSAHYIQQLCDLFGKSSKELGLLLEEPAASSEPSPAADSSPLWTVPYRRNPFFTGREEVLNQLHDKLTTTKSAALSQTQAISGLGGIGKTQIAVEYAYRHRDEYQAVLWVRAASQGALISDFVSLAGLLLLPEQNEQDQNKVVTAVKRWLTHHKGWLFILDNADDLELVAEFLPTGDNGHILLTTRAQATGSIAPAIAVEKMGQEEGTLLLLRRTKLLAPNASLEQANEEERTQTQAIVEAMDGLPLALDQAGAYIEETGCGLSGYLELYRTHRKKLLQRRSAIRADHPEPVASTWALSFLNVEQANPAAGDLLRLCSFLDPDAIPEEILTEGPSLFGPVLGPVVADPLQLNEAIQMLRRFSLVKRDPEAKLLNVHRLVQAVLRDGMDEQTQREWAERTVMVVAAAFPTVEFAHWQRCQEYLPHAQTCAELIEQYHLTFPEAAHLLMRVGSYQRERGLYTQTEPLFQRALTICEQVLGPDHPQTAVTLGYLALLYIYQGKYAQAEPLFQRALAICEQILGPEHLQTAETLNNLALLYYLQSKYTQAEPLYQRALALKEQILGPEHPQTAETLGYLALLYTNQGKYTQAESLFQRALAFKEQVLGPEHPQTAETLNNLALLYWKQGKYAQAEPLYQRALAIHEQVLGPEHPQTAETLGYLAQLYTNQGKYTQAEPLYQRALALWEQTLGPEHHYIAITLNNLAQHYYLQGKYAQAEPLYQRAVALAVQALGPEHLDTAIPLGNLARLYTEQGRYEQAEPLHQRALALEERILGPEHLDTAITLGNLGHHYDLLGRYEQAESFLQRALTILEHTVGPGHPRLATTLIHLAQLYEHQTCYAQAEPLYQRALTIREQALGSEHPNTIAVRASYTDMLEQMKKTTEATKKADPD